MTKQIKVGNFYLLENELYQLVQADTFKLCMIHVVSGNRLTDPIVYGSSPLALSEIINDAAMIRRLIPADYDWKPVTITISYKHDVVTTVTHSEKFTI